MKTILISMSLVMSILSADVEVYSSFMADTFSDADGLWISNYNRMDI